MKFPVIVLAALLAVSCGCSPPPSGGMRPSSDAKGGGSSKAGGGSGGADKGGKGGQGGQQSDKGGSGSNSGSGGGSSNSSGGSSSSSSDNGSSPANDTTVSVSPDEQRLGGIRIVEVAARMVPRTLSVPGQIMMDDQRTAHIAPYSDGLVVDVLKVPGDFVQRGSVLAHLHSHSVHETVGALAVNFANVDRQQAAVTYATAKRDRYAHLYSIQAASLEQQQVSDQELVAAVTNLADAKAAVIMEREHLADILQIEPESITPATLYTYENVPVKAPMSGTVITRSITPGMAIAIGQEAYTISNLGEVWMVASVNETELPHLRAGQHVTVRTDAWPGQTFNGSVTLIGSSLDPATRTIQVRATLPNAQNKLKPQMFTTAMLDETESRRAIFVPESALQDVNGLQAAFVTNDGTHFTARTVKTAAPVSGQVEITEGLQPGDHIAVAGAFMLKSALLKSTMDSE